MTGQEGKHAKFGAADVAALLDDGALKRPDLILKIMEVTHCKKSTAYNLVNAAEDQTIRLNEHDEFVVA